MVYWINGESQANYKEVKKGKWMTVKDTWLRGPAPRASKRDFMEHANDSKLLQKEEKKMNNKQKTQKLILIKYLGFRKKVWVFFFCFFVFFFNPTRAKRAVAHEQAMFCTKEK